MFARLYTHKFFRNHNYYDREKYENILKDPESKLGRKIARFIDSCIFLTVGVIILGTVSDWSIDFRREIFILDALVSLVFAGEYLYRFFRARKKGYFVSRPMNVIDFLSFAPFFIGLLFLPIAGLEILKILRLLRILRLFEVSIHSPIALGFMRTLRGYGQEYKAILGIFTTVLVIISTFVYYFEHLVNPQFSSIPESLWWGIVTMTTVGYGDIAPITLGGKIFGVVLILLGPVLLAVISSITILVFMDVAESHKHSLFKTCAKCRSRNPDEANFCMICGSEHFISGIEDERESKIGFIKKLFSKK